MTEFVEIIRGNTSFGSTQNSQRLDIAYYQNFRNLQLTNNRIVFRRDARDAKTDFSVLWKMYLDKNLPFDHHRFDNGFHISRHTEL